MTTSLDARRRNLERERPRLRAAGKFLVAGDEKVWVRGVTYGAFRPDAAGREYADSGQIERDFAAMARHGLNAVRIPHTLPPRSLLDAAARHGLRVMVGLGAEQHAGFLLDGRGERRVAAEFRRRLSGCAGHPALLCYALGNEIPAPLVRWLGAKRVSRHLERLARIVKEEDPEGLVTYVNYPTTEYLELPFLDLVAFNVYLESADAFARYLARLQNLAGDRPLLMSELGLDSLRHGEAAQAQAVDWQIRTAFGAGCCGAFVFSWTDEWFRAGEDVHDWSFGLVDRERRPKPALAALRRATSEVPFPNDLARPRISVVVCSYNGAHTIADCCEGLRRLAYPDFEVIVVDDGSTDATSAIARSHGFRVIRTPNRGLSAARNTGLEAASGEIVAYLDDDARPDPDWLAYLAAAFLRSDHAGIGGPNVAPPGDGIVADAVAAAPGGPIHVLLADEVAEHVPGCNMAFRAARLREVGGFDERFRVAGDDVDLCWRLQQKGFTIGFCAAAMVWHHRRGSLRAYWRQQRGYGRAEALLERKWPEKYNALGHASWAGRVYSESLIALERGRGRIYHGLFGSAPFQALYRAAPSSLGSLVSMPEWNLAVVGLASAAALGALWRPMLWALPLLGFAVAAPLARAVVAAERVPMRGRPRRLRERLAIRALVALLHLLQPLARLRGRLSNGLSPLRRRGRRGLAWPLPRVIPIWSERWREPLERIAAVEAALRADGLPVRRGDAHARWDLEVRGGCLGAVRLLMAVEDHGAGRQYVRLRSRPRCSGKGVAASLVLAGLAALAARDRSLLAAALLAAASAGVILRTAVEGMAATAAVIRASAHAAERAPAQARAPARRLWRRLAAQARPYAPQLAGVFLLSLLATPLALLAPLPLKIAVDNAIGGRPLPRFLGLLPAGLDASPGFALGVAIGLVVLHGLLVYLHSLALWLLETHVGERLVLEFRALLFRRLQRLSLAYHDARGTADSMHRIQFDAPALRAIALGGTIPLLTSSVTLAGMIAVIASLHWQLAAVALGISPLLFLLAGGSRRRLRARWAELKSRESSAFGVIQEAFAALRVVKAFGREDHEASRFALHGDAIASGHLRLAWIEGGFDLLVGLTVACGTAAALFVGVRSVEAGTLTLGALLVVMSYLAQLYGPLEAISKRVADLQSSFASAERAFALLDEPHEVPERTDARPVSRARGALELRDVAFSYGAGRAVLEGVRFSVEPGTRVGIVGVSGAGKSTLVSLLLRFYDPTTGSILLDGVDLREYRLRDLRDQFAIVLQDPVLFSTSVAENVAYGRPGASREEVVAAARAANAHDFVERLPDGYETRVGERGMCLSGGERQRIALARAFLKDAPILILDEPTSSVDLATEDAVIDALGRLIEGRTAIVIAHRASTLRRCNVVLRLDGGRVVEHAARRPAPLGLGLTTAAAR